MENEVKAGIIVDFPKLRELAKLATPGPWKRRDYIGGHYGVDVEKPKDWRTTVFAPRVGHDGYGSGGSLPADADYIAAVSPEVVSLLLDHIDELHRSIANAEKQVDGIFRALGGRGGKRA